MKTPEYSSHREIEIEKIELSDGETAFFDGKAYQKGVNPEYGYPYAKADTFVIGKNGPEIEAFGGPCMIVTIFDHDQKIGAIVHIDAADTYGNRHEELIRALSEALQGLKPNFEVHLFGDIESADPDIQALKEVRTKWKNAITETLRDEGITNIQEFVKGDYKDVRLDTANGSIRVFDLEHRLLFEKK